MVDREKFVQNVQNLLDAGQTEKEIGSYIQKLGFSEKEAKDFIAEVLRGKSKSDKSLMNIVPKNMEEQLKHFDKQKESDQKELFKENIEEMTKIMNKMQMERQMEKEEAP